MSAFSKLKPFDDQGLVNAIIETPQGSRSKYRYSVEDELFECGRALTAGLSYPFNFGFIPSTLVEDGDPLDIIVLMDQPAFPGCLVHTKILGTMEAEQTENGVTIRNDRLLGVQDFSVVYAELNSYTDVPKKVIEEIERFFIFTNQCRGRVFQPKGWKDADAAIQAIKMSIVAKVR